MLHLIRKIITPPVFEDETRTRKAGLLNTMLLIILVSSLIAVPALLILNAANAMLNVLLVTPAIVAAGALLYLLHRGYLDFASVSLAVVLLIAATANTWFYDGIRGLTSTYFMVIAVITLLSSRNTMLIFGLCLLAMLGVYTAEVVGRINFPLLPPLRPNNLLLTGAVFCMVTFLLQAGANNLTRALDQSRRNERALAERTTELAESHAALEREMAERVQIEQDRAQLQQQLIRELSTPIIPLISAPGRAGSIIVIPLIGSIDNQRAKDITRALLAGIQEHRAKIVIIDITGVSIMDSDVVNHLNKTIHAARLKGARTIVTGVSDAVAETIVDLGIDWSSVDVLGNLQTGLLGALDKMGLHIERKLTS